MAKYLHDHGGYTVFNVTYPSTQRDIAANAKSLGHIIEHLDGIEEINFVAHSLGNIVVRRWLADQTDAASGRRPDGADQAASSCWPRPTTARCWPWPWATTRCIAS